MVIFIFVIHEANIIRVFSRLCVFLPSPPPQKINIISVCCPWRKLRAADNIQNKMQ